MIPTGVCLVISIVMIVVSVFPLLDDPKNISLWIMFLGWIFVGILYFIRNKKEKRPKFFNTDCGYTSSHSFGSELFTIKYLLWG